VIVIGLDLGTTNCKALALSEDGRLIGSAASEHSLDLPKPGWAEQSAQVVWESAAGALRLLVPTLPRDQISGIALSGAMHSLVLIDHHDAPLAPAMTWADQRSAAQAIALRKSLGRKTGPSLVDFSAPPPQDPVHELYVRTGCPLVYLYSLAKLRWWQEDALDLFHRAVLFVTLKDFVLRQLTGEWATDWGIASTSGLLDIHKRTWDDEVLKLAGISAARLPSLVSPTTTVGKLTQAAARATGLAEGLPVVAGSSDGGMADIGSGAYQPGTITVTIGTSGAVRKVVSQPYLDPYERTWCYIQTGQYWFAGGATNNGGIVVQWVREQLFNEMKEADGYQSLFSSAAEVPPGAEGILFIPYLSGERSPSWDASARGILLGLTLRHGRPQIARAVLEGVAFCLADIWEALGLVDEPGRLSGGITREPVWMQIVADVLGTRLGALEVGDASAVGAAMLGHQALGTANLQSLSGKVQPSEWFQPDPARHEVYQRVHKMFQEMARKLEHSIVG
jgi:gluconokinase